MDLTLQVKLLRVLQSGEFTKVGGSEVERADVRYLCATNRDPWAEVQAGRFREDLYYRLHVVPCAMPPLRERDGDVLLLARHFLALYAEEEGKSFTDFEPKAVEALTRYSWPGNIRELQNVLRNIVLFNDGPIVTAAMLSRLDPNARGASPPPIATLAPAALRLAGEPGRTGAVKPLWQIEKEAIEEALALCGGNVPRAAALLEVNPSTIYRRKAEWDKERLALSRLGTGPRAPASVSSAQFSSAAAACARSGRARRGGALDRRRRRGQGSGADLTGAALQRMRRASRRLRGGRRRRSSPPARGTRRRRVRRPSAPRRRRYARTDRRGRRASISGGSLMPGETSCRRRRAFRAAAAPISSDRRRHGR